MLYSLGNDCGPLVPFTAATINVPSRLTCGTGWGFCHSCHATVLVQPNAPVIASSQGNRYGQRSANGGGLVIEQAQHICLCPLCAHTCYDGCVLRHLFHTGNKRKWLLSELLLPLMRAALASSRRAQLYLTERGIPPTLALASWRWLPLACGLGTSPSVERAAATLEALDWTHHLPTWFP